MKALALSFALVALFTFGCSTPKPLPPALVSVKLKVYDRSGKPLKDAVITLNPTGEDNGSTRPSGVVTTDGSLTLECIPGPYTATVAPLPKQGHGDAGDGAVTDPSKASTTAFPAGYRTANDSPWKIEVKPSGNGDFVLKIY